ncbi:hypothetical protein GGR56DRAFT_679100 [Xylariaceae sp. FL0804]|nr:hypothetical protein GGR56DRAFT_679100 [Xylariaceae sp. FL0804]
MPPKHAAPDDDNDHDGLVLRKRRRLRYSARLRVRLAPLDAHDGHGGQEEEPDPEQIIYLTVDPDFEPALIEPVDEAEKAEQHEPEEEEQHEPEEEEEQQHEPEEEEVHEPEEDHGLEEDDVVMHEEEDHEEENDVVIYEEEELEEEELEEEEPEEEEDVVMREEEEDMEEAQDEAMVVPAVIQLHLLDDAALASAARPRGRSTTTWRVDDHYPTEEDAQDQEPLDWIWPVGFDEPPAGTAADKDNEKQSLPPLLGREAHAMLLRPLDDDGHGPGPGPGHGMQRRHAERGAHVDIPGPRRVEIKVKAKAAEEGEGQQQNQEQEQEEDDEGDGNDTGQRLRDYAAMASRGAAALLLACACWASYEASEALAMAERRLARASPL